MSVDRVMMQMMKLAVEIFHRINIYNTAAPVLQAGGNRLALFAAFGRQSRNAGISGT
jgi:hypothetical protein